MTAIDRLQDENSTLRNRIAHLELLLAQQSPAASPTAHRDDVLAAPVPQPELHKAPEIHFNGSLNASEGLPATALVANTGKGHTSELGGDQGKDEEGAAQGGNETQGSDTPRWSSVPHGLTQQQISRYSRQLILPSFGVEAQARLCASSVLVIGAGGLGCPAALYLAGAGVGRLGLVDRDGVDVSNLHRQIAHTEARVGVHKAESAAIACRALNSSIEVATHTDGLTPSNALELIRSYDIIVDASDNANTRYLISDACVVAGKPLVSGAALGMDGQLTVYNHGADGPCYRCLFPESPRPQSCARCSDAGVLGVVPGIVGCLQAMEAIKLAAGVGAPLSRKLLLLDALSGRIHTVKLRTRSAACVSCGPDATITAATIASYDYAVFTGQATADDGPPKPLRLLPASERLSASALAQRLQDRSLLEPKTRDATILDVRPAEQFVIGHLAGAVNIPYDEFDRRHLEAKQLCSGAASSDGTPEGSLFIVCRRGNDSQEAVQRLRGWGFSQAVDLIGGLEAWQRDVDGSFPCY